MLSVCEEKQIRSCEWSSWFDDETMHADSRGWRNRRGIIRDGEEYDEVELLEDAMQYSDVPASCVVPSDIECRTVDNRMYAYQTGDDVTCKAETGLKCKKNGLLRGCEDYEVRFLCCTEYTVTCGTTPGI